MTVPEQPSHPEGSDMHITGIISAIIVGYIGGHGLYQR
jgi:hypothetical protein